MNKRIAALLGGTAALMTVHAGYAAAAVAPNPTAAPTPQSYAQLLEPIPNAVAQLRADDAARAQQPLARVQLAQYYHHHHHHHHHGYYGGAAILGGVIGGLLAPQPRYYGPPPTCYWTLGRPYWNGYRWIRPRVRVCQ